MSMISAQCDGLRKIALWLDDEFYDVDAAEVRRAADTIWDLRCKLAGMVDQRDEIDQLKAENAKLRKLCKDIWNDACHFDEFWDYVYDDGTIYREDELPHYQERMRGLGIEVD